MALIEKTVLDWLNGILSVPVYPERPKNVPSSFVIIEKTGGTEVDHLRRAEIAVQSYADSLYNAASLDEDVGVAMAGLIGEKSIASVDQNSSYNFTNTTTKEYRYQSVFEIIYYWED